MSLQKINNNIAECKKGIEIAEARLKSNNELLKSREKDREAWRNRKNTHNAHHEQERVNRENAIKKWQAKYDQIRDSLSKQRQDGSCAAAWNCGNSNCPSGWINDGSVHGTQGNCDICLGIACAQTGCRVKCRKPDDVLDREAREITASQPLKFPWGEVGLGLGYPKPDKYDPPAFTETEPGDIQLDNTPLTIGCCNNIATILSSDLKDADIQQQSECLGNLQQQAGKATPEKSVSNVNQKSPVEKSVIEKPVDKDTSSTKSMIIILLIICVLILILIGVGFFVF